eukprot:PITA_05679
MGPQGLYLNKWSPEFDPAQDVPTAVPVWVRLPHLPLHCWSQNSLQSIGNALGRYIDQAPRNDQYSCARICVEVDLEVGLPEAIKLPVADWTHIQELDYEQLPFKCRHCHEYGHFAKYCKKKNEETVEKEKGEQWKQVKKSANNRQNNKNKGKETGNKEGQENGSTQNGGSKDTIRIEEDKNPFESLNPSSDSPEAEREDPPQQNNTDPSDPGNTPNPNPCITSSPSYADIIKQKKKNVENEGTSDEETLERTSKRAGRKSNREAREEESERQKTLGSQATIEMTLGRNSRQRAPKGGKVVSARGSAGGIGTFWSKNFFSLESSHVTQHWIYTELRHTVSNFKLALFNMYVTVHYDEKKDCWKTLLDYLELHNPLNIVIGGDLNIILDHKEKRGGTNLRDPLLITVENLIQQWDLVDFKPVKGKYTWTNNRTGDQHISARLDRFLTSSSIMLNKRIVFSKIILKLTSDHKPILLCLKEEDLVPLPFRFSPLWTEREGFYERVQTAWRIEISGSPSYVWEQKMKNTKKALKEWIKKVTVTPTSQRKDVVNQLEDLQGEMEEKDISAMDLDNEKTAQRKTYNSFRIEEEYWRIKSRSLWLKAGDRNTKYFHRQYRARLSRNHIAEIITSRGQVCRGFDQIKEAAVNHFQNLLSANKEGSEEDAEEFLTNIPQLVSAKDNNILLRPSTKEEIANIVWSMELDKAPRPDGFSIHLYNAGI